MSYADDCERVLSYLVQLCRGCGQEIYLKIYTSYARCDSCKKKEQIESKII